MFIRLAIAYCITNFLALLCLNDKIDENGWYTKSGLTNSEIKLTIRDIPALLVVCLILGFIPILRLIFLVSVIYLATNSAKGE